jgi:hypothetical protein
MSIYDDTFFDSPAPLIVEDDLPSSDDLLELAAKVYQFAKEDLFL